MSSITNKTKASTIALFLVLTIAVTIVAIPPATAQAPYRKTTYAYIGALPNPVGVNQDVLLHIGITDYLLIATDGWKGLSVTIKRPDGKTDTITDITTDSTGGTGRTYTPDIPGNYTLQTHFPEQNYTWVMPPSFNPALIGTVTYLASVSEELTLVVQEDPVPYYPGNALPTEYWTRPIDAQLREWYTVAGNWVTTPDNMFAPYNDDAPETAHILWTKPHALGGVAGGATGEHSYDMGDAYRGKWPTPAIIHGVIYYNKGISSMGGGTPQQGIVAVDLKTGEELWVKEGITLAFGQTMYWSSVNMHGVFSYLWETVGTTWNAYDPLTGDWVYTMNNVPPSGVMFGASLMRRGENGEILIYTIDQANGWLAMWNSSNLIPLRGMPDPTIPFMGFLYYSWMPEGKTVDAGVYQWNVTIDKGLPGGVNRVLEDRIIGSTLGMIGATAPTEVVFWAVDTTPENKGRLLFNQTWKTPSGDLEISFSATSVEDGVFTLWAKETRVHYAFDIDTGRLLWGPSEPQHYLDIFYATTNAIAYGNLYSTGVSGQVHCYDVTTGDRLWTYYANDPYQEILWANDWWLSILFITDGKIYVGHEEHSPIDPRPRGGPFICLNATTGEEIWRANGLFRQTHWGDHAIIGDSIIATQDTYDQRVYAIGKGPSATTVTAPDISVPFDTPVMIRGTVTDISPGTEEYALRARFPNGVPAVSDANMSDWMLYVYKQFERPADVVGVEVTISVVDPNNNCYEVATTTSDASGFFSAEFEPLVPGKYTVIATFEGSQAYYGSFAETSLLVEEAPAATPPPTPTPAPMTDTYVLSLGIAAIIAIVVIGLVLILMLRKR
jgi:outer membrane protein assembly factor BamB